MATKDLSTFQNEYNQCLANNKGARELGLKAVASEVGLLDISKIHHNALNKILSAPVISRSEQFLKEVLSSFENKYSELEKANLELSAFSRILTHDLCSPLRNITAFGKILKEESYSDLNDRGKDFLSRIISSSQKVNKLIDSLFVLATITKKELALDTADLSNIARGLMDELRSKEPDRKVNVSIPDGIVVKGDPELLKEALRALIENAWKFTRKTNNAKIEFGTKKENKKDVHFIKDNGVGFDMKYSDKLFNAFQRLSVEEAFAGPGLGLFAAKKIIEKHGGNIWTEAEENKGATFYFTINV
jgi:light-regulated signal transduction histidine kinase (bacteriophytochrome)